MSDLTRDGEKLGEALAGVGVLGGAVRVFWRKLFPSAPKKSVPTLDSLSERVDDIKSHMDVQDTKLNEISTAVATLTGEFHGYIEGRRRDG